MYIKCTKLKKEPPTFRVFITDSLSLKKLDFNFKVKLGSRGTQSKSQIKVMFNVLLLAVQPYPL